LKGRVKSSTSFAKDPSLDKPDRINVLSGEHKDGKDQSDEEGKNGPKMGCYSSLGSREALPYDKRALANTRSEG
jgi:hypothetical protein